MPVEIIKKNFTLDIHGFSGTAVNKDYAAAAFALMDKMWQTLRTKEIKNKGINIWVYEENEKVFAGTEIYDPFNQDTGLEHKVIDLAHYAYTKHIGPYGLIKRTGQNMRDELMKNGFEPGFPYVEIYGHWTKDENKLETELLISLK
jgi:hypothetical protein